MFLAGLIGVAVTMLLVLIRVLAGPTVYDRILAINLFGTKTVLLIAILGFFSGRPDFLDLAITYALINFIGTVAVLKFMQYGDLGWTGEANDESDV
ncbi:monovalent cation/H+ antiporter complex subunit F [Salinisphaera sp.]|uniref:monovalent cation/H+ antiporter complex subunit F n=1 Tax=Salinisphaera sp. TaxID=1914330 RepID=UPI002D764D79|nr:monovalent cation/H+ antiporter complex subunit F [Salinisphaera sp.]HET7313742.1 monovalent cation/H+ antiporter complex subunit F [Salinisphaera sp.]